MKGAAQTDPALASEQTSGMAALPAPEALACLSNWRTSGACGQWCLRETQEDRKHCYVFLDCYYNNNCGPSTCGAPDAVCGVNKFRWGMAPKIIADQVYQCLACPGSTPVTSCSGLPDTTPCTDGNACTSGERCRTNVCRGGTPLVCTALDQCHNAGTCNPANGVCSNPTKPNGTPCNDGNACTSPDQCQIGTCQGTVTLGTPSNLVATAGSGAVQLTWTAAVGATGYYVKRATVAGGPYTTVAIVTTASYLDAHRAIGPTYYYVVTAFAACGESAPTNQAQATPFSDKTPTGPGPGPCKPAAASAMVAARSVLGAGADLKAPPEAIVAKRGVGPLQPRLTMAQKAAATQHRYARVQYKLETVNGTVVVTPTFAQQLDGLFVDKPVLSDRLLVVGRTAKETNFVATVSDPRTRRPVFDRQTPTRAGNRLAEGGILVLDLPETFLSSDVLAQTTFSFFGLSDSVSAKLPVSIAGLPALMAGATPLATSSGAAVVPLLKANR